MIIGIVAVDRNGAIGKDGKLPWHYSNDMKFFKRTTTGNAVVMGRRTWLTLNKPLPNRLNIVLSRTADIPEQDSLIVKRAVDDVLKLLPELKSDLFVIGGAQIYESFLPYIDKWLVTEVPLTVDGADTFVPKNYLDGFVLTDEEDIGDGLTVQKYVKAS
jgi:dihydrofolate reductase